MRALRIAAYTVAVTALVALGAQAQDSNASRRLTYLTFSSPVEVPGMTLPAGTYRFQLASTQTSLHAVQVLSQDGTKLLTTFSTVPDIRSSADTPKETVVMFQESAPGAPQAIRVWFYAGNPAGEQFVYPRRQAIEIAKANHTTVPSSDDSRTVTQIDENGNSVAANRNAREQSQVARADTAPPSPPPTTSNANANPARVNPPASTAPAAAAQATNNAPAQQPRPRTLPQTASDLEWIGLLSLVSLMGGVAAGRVRRYV